MKYIDGEATQFAQNQIFDYNPDEDILPGIEYIDQLDEISLFADGIKDRLAALDHADILGDSKKLVSTLSGYCNEADVSISRQTLENWLTKAAPNGNKTSRENVYKLCFALKMDELQTGEFFLKAYLERPFNYKNIREATYYFCLRTGRNYKSAEALIQKIENASYVEKPDAVTVTEQIGEAIRMLDNEDDFIKYIVDNRSGFAEQNRTASKLIAELIRLTMPLAEAEYNFMHSGDKKLSVNSVDDLLSVIYDYSARKTSEYNKVFKSSIKNSDFPKSIKRNFPERQEIQNISKGNASYDVIRKALIMLKFYHFFATARINRAAPNDLFDEFVVEMDETLMNCGYVQLYWRNPYDWMIGYCAFTDEPLDMLRDLIYEYYLSKVE